jgi:hypothetical protein
MIIKFSAIYVPDTDPGTGYPGPPKKQPPATKEQVDKAWVNRFSQKFTESEKNEFLVNEYATSKTIIPPGIPKSDKIKKQH